MLGRKVQKMDQQEREIATATMQDLVEGLKDLFSMVLDSQAPTGYEIVIKKSGTDDFVRERDRANVVKEQPQPDDEIITVSKERLKTYLQKVVKKVEKVNYDKGYKQGLAEGRKENTTPKPNRPSHDKNDRSK